MPQGHAGSSTYFSQRLEADQHYVKVLTDSTLIQNVDDVLVRSRTLLDSPKDTFHLLQQLAITGQMSLRTRFSCAYLKSNTLAISYPKIGYC